MHLGEISNNIIMNKSMYYTTEHGEYFYSVAFMSWDEEYDHASLWVNV